MSSITTAATAAKEEDHQGHKATLAAVENHETYLSEGIPSAAALAPNPLVQFSKWFTHAQAQPSLVPEPEAMSVSTVRMPDGIPSTRVVLLKQVDETGLVFYTNYASRKGRELFPDGDYESDSPRGAYVSCAFYWRALHLSVRFVGRAEKVDRATTQRYFDSRPVGSRVGAWASAQSQVLESGERGELERRVNEFERRFNVPLGTATGSAVAVGPGNPVGEQQQPPPPPSPPAAAAAAAAEPVEIPVPPFWGGVRIVPFEVEFWAGRESRLHDRYRYTRSREGVTPGDNDHRENEEGWKVERLSP